MWQIFEHRNLQRHIRRLPEDILKRFEKWKDIVEISGPKGLRLIRGFNDEPLSGKWKGYRSFRLSRQYRVIDRIKRKELFVLVIEISAHDYRRK